MNEKVGPDPEPKNEKPKGKKYVPKPPKTDKDVLQELVNIAEEVERELRFSPDFYKAAAVRMIHHLHANRPGMFSQLEGDS